jgi:hypothetical protein
MLLPVVVVGFAAIGAALPELRGDVAEGPERNFDNWKGLAAGIAQADKAALFEGTPHPLDEKKHYDEEMRTAKFKKFFGIPFYPDPTPLSAEVNGKILKVLLKDKTLVPYTGDKKCGGFHADWCLEWRGDDGVARCMLCFSCYEARVFGPKSSLQCDIDPSAIPELRAILTPFREHAPPKENTKGTAK